MSDSAAWAIAAYERLKQAEQNRPSVEDMDTWRKAQIADERRRKINRLRSRVA